MGKLRICKACDGNIESNWYFKYCYSCSMRCKCGFKIGDISEYRKNFKIGGEDYIRGLYKIYRMDTKNIYIARGFLIMIKDHFEEYEDLANKYLMLM